MTISTAMNGTTPGPIDRMPKPYRPNARPAISATPAAVLSAPNTSRPARYSPVDSGVTNTLRRLRAHTSSRNARESSPCVR
jgi:hypothetical protein